MDETARLSLPFIMPQQAQKHVTHNEALQALDVLVQPVVESRAITTPPTTPVLGEAYIVPSGATGAWAGHADEIAAWQAGAWLFYDPAPGWQAYVKAEKAILVFDTGAWTRSRLIRPRRRPHPRHQHRCRQHQSPRRRRRRQPLHPCGQWPPAQAQQGSHCRYGQPALPDQLFRPRRNGPHGRRCLAPQGQRQWLDLDQCRHHQQCHRRHDPRRQPCARPPTMP